MEIGSVGVGWVVVGVVGEESVRLGFYAVMATLVLGAALGLELCHVMAHRK